MGWYDQEWTHRWAISVDNTSGGSSSGDVEIVVPSDWDGWDVIQADGDDIRVTTADGQTLASYDLSGFDYANRTVTIQVDGVTLSGVAGMDVLWVYAGNASAADATSVVTITSALSGYIELGRPSTHVFEARPEQSGATRPRIRLNKTADEQVFVWQRIDHLLERRTRVYEGHRNYEEPVSIVVGVTTGGASQASMFTVSKQRIVEFRGKSGLREQWVRSFVKAGSSGTNYTLETAIRTVLPSNTTNRILEPRAYLSVKDVSEA